LQAAQVAWLPEGTNTPDFLQGSVQHLYVLHTHTEIYLQTQPAATSLPCCIWPGPTQLAAGTPVKEALELAVKHALQARKGVLLPGMLLPGGAGCSSSSGWAAAGSSRLVAALSAAEINMNLRARVRMQ
jgi:hypothetical protein